MIGWMLRGAAIVVMMVILSGCFNRSVPPATISVGEDRSRGTVTTVSRVDSAKKRMFWTELSYDGGEDRGTVRYVMVRVIFDDPLSYLETGEEVFGCSNDLPSGWR